MKLGEKVKDYLAERFGPRTTLRNIERLGEGVHGIAYLVRFETEGEERRLIMKTLFPSGFGHDHFSDRAQVLLLAHANYNGMPRHVKAVDVVGETPKGLKSIGDAEEFYLFMEEARGPSYFSDLNEILSRGYLTDFDRERAATLASFLVRLHALKYEGKDARILYRRRIRDLMGHGECIMGIIDTYDSVEFTDGSEFLSYAAECLPWWWKIRDRSERLARVHGDYHPGNIRFTEEGLTLLDRSRGSWGEPADDVSCLLVNYLHYAVKDRGRFDGPFAELFRIFSTVYLEETGDRPIFQVLQPFFAFRILVVANPKFYPDDRSEVKRKLLDWGHAVLQTETFDMEELARRIPGT